MDPKNKVHKKVELVLAEIEAKINKLKEKVEKLCESTDCFESLGHNTDSVDNKTQKK
jgi:hypothetical protein